MTFYHGTAARFYYGTLDFSGYTEQVEAQLTRSMGEYRVLNAAGVGRIAGQRDVRVTLTGGPLDPAAGANDITAFDMLDDGTHDAWAFLPYGDALGRTVYLGQSLGENQQRVAGDDVIRLPVALVTSQQLDRGVVLRALAAGGASPGASVNNAAPTTNGGCGYLICTANTGNLDVVIQDSANNADWADIVTFTQLAGGAEGSQAITVTGAVRQYLRATWTISAAATFFVAFGRR
ncbi:MAG: hypothetical protein ABFE07_13410 [Armatimonadia bacterium]